MSCNLKVNQYFQQSLFESNLHIAQFFNMKVHIFGWIKSYLFLYNISHYSKKVGKP